jgi:hypothetical protein
MTKPKAGRPPLGEKSKVMINTRLDQKELDFVRELGGGVFNRGIVQLINYYQLQKGIKND